MPLSLRPRILISRAKNANGQGNGRPALGVMKDQADTIHADRQHAGELALKAGVDMDMQSVIYPETLLQSLPFNDDINNALLHYEGTAGKILRTVDAHERGNWQDVDWQALEALGLSQQRIEEAYLDALKWAADVMQSLLE